jgi:DNA helicase-2/ATP-dependent DNA helicase PcrA
MSLSQNSIPYKTKGGPSFFARKEIKTALAYMKLLVNPADSAAFAQAIAYPKRGIGDVLLGKIDLLAKERGVDVTEAAAAIKTGRQSARAHLDEFIALLEQKRSEMRSGKSLMGVVEELMKQSGYMGHLKNEAEEETDGPRSIQRPENLETFVTGIGEFEDANSKPTIEKFLQQIALVQDGDKDQNADAVSMMSMHSSKGLEFPVVFVVGAADGTIPHVFSVNEGRKEEERRLFYVALTRAKDQLHVSYPKEVMKWRKLVHQNPSPFLLEMDGIEE